MRCAGPRPRLSARRADRPLRSQPEIDWLDWLRRWDAQQQGYVPQREARFEAMFDVLAELMPASFVALDLACGPGSISQRLLARFPAAHAIAVDIDPVMLAIGRARSTRSTAAYAGSRPTWRCPTGCRIWVRLGSTRCSAARRCIGCGPSRWLGCITTSLGCCALAVWFSTPTTWPSVRRCRLRAPERSCAGRAMDRRGVCRPWDRDR